MMKAIIFDMDGVLVKTPVWPIHNKLLSKYGVNVSKKQVRKYLGRPLVNQVELLKEDYGIKLNKEDYVKKFKKLQKENTNRIQKSIELIKLMEKLMGNNFKLAVATSSTRKRAVDILNNLGIIKYFETLVTKEQIKNQKPHPEIFLKTVKNLKLKPSECVVIEDAVNGIEAAKKGGIKVIGLVGKYHSRLDFKNADLVIDSLDEINLNLIKKL